MNPGLKESISVTDSAKGFVDVIEKLDIAKTSEGIHSYDGTVYPW